MERNEQIGDISWRWSRQDVDSLWEVEEMEASRITSGSLVQLQGCIWLFSTSWTASRQASLSFTIYHSLLKLISIESMIPSNHLVLCRPLLLPSVFPSIRVFSNELALRIRWPKNRSFSFSPSNEHSGLISFRMDWLDRLPAHRTLESSPAPQFKSINSLAFSLLLLSNSHIGTWLLEKP